MNNVRLRFVDARRRLICCPFSLCWQDRGTSWAGAPLFPCFLDGNTTSTIHYKYAPPSRRKQAFEFGCADGASQGSRTCSHVYEITWLWNFGLSLDSVDIWWPKQKGHAESLGLKRPGALGRPCRPGSVPLKRYDMYIPCVYLSYSCSLKHVVEGIV